MSQLVRVLQRWKNTICIGLHPTVPIVSQETAAQNPDPDAENSDAAAETQRFLTSLKESMEQNEGTTQFDFLLSLSRRTYEGFFFFTVTRLDLNWTHLN